MPDSLRITFSKTGRARFISHLDLMRVFQRAFYRAELPLRYTQGYNPHVVLSIALPLSVGQAGVCEILDLGITDTEATLNLAALPEHLNGLLPEGVAISSAVRNGRTAQDVIWARYRISMHTDAAPETFLSMFDSPLIVEKRTKKGSKPTDLLPMIRQYRCVREGERLVADMELAAQNPTLNPDYITAEFERRIGREVSAEITRIALLDAEGNAF